METEPTNKDLKEFKASLKLYKVDMPTYIIMLVVHRDYEKNDISRLGCKKMLPLEGYPQTNKLVPMGGYVYDSVNDSYLVNCIDYLSLGYIPFCFKLKLENVGMWSITTPLSETTVRRYLPVAQRNDLDRFKNVFASEAVNFDFIQFIGTA